MARSNPAAALLALVPALGACTAFNGKTIFEDAGATGADGAAGPCACPSSAIVCETFEANVGTLWSSFGSAPTPDASRHHCGNASLHMRTPALAVGQDDNSGLVESQTLLDSRLADGFYARVWAYVPDTSTIATGNYLSFLEVQQDAGNFLGIAAQFGASTVAVSDWAATPNEFHEASTPLPRGNWTCIEWHVGFSASDGASQVWIDGSDTTAAFSGKTTVASPAFNRLFVAVYFSGIVKAQPAFDLWIDDLAIAPQRVGCGG